MPINNMQQPSGLGHNIYRKLLPLILCMLSVAWLSGCSFGAAVDDEGPRQVVRSFVEALEARDAGRLLDLIEPADWRKEIGPELRSYVAYIETLSFRDPQYTVMDNTGDQAHVRLVSTLEYTIKDVKPGEQKVDLVFEVVRIDGIWYLRSFNLPQPEK